MYGRPSFSAVLRWWLAAALVLFQLSAHAVAWNKSTDFLWNSSSGNITVFPGAGSGNMWSSGVASKAPTATGPEFTFGAKQLPFNPSPAANFKAKFKAADIAKAIAKPGVSLIGPMLLGSAIKALVDVACVRLAGGSMQLAAGEQWEECNMTSTTEPSWRVDNPPLNCSGACTLVTPTATGACQHYGDHYVKTNSDIQIVGVSVAPIAGLDANTVLRCTVNWTYAGSSRTSQTDVRHNGPATTLYSQDGWKPATPDRAESLLSTKATEWTQADFTAGYQARPSGNLAEVVDFVFNQGGQIEVDSISASGPATMTGTPTTTTTTNPDGSTIQTTKTPTTTYTYNNPTSTCSGTSSCNITISSSTTNVTTTTNTPAGGGTPTTTTTTETKKDDPVDDCKANPTAVRCAQLGDPAAADTLSKDTKQITIGTVAFTGGTCPQPVSFTAFSKSYSFQYTPLCDKLAMLAPLFLVLSAFAAAYIFADGFKTS